MKKFEELALYTINNGTIYREKTLLIIESLAKKINNYSFDALKAPKTFEPIAKSGAIAYHAEFKKTTFSRSDIKEASKELFDHYQEYIFEVAENERPEMEKFDTIYLNIKKAIKQIEALSSEKESTNKKMKSLPREEFLNNFEEYKSKLIPIDEKLLNKKAELAYLKNNARIALANDYGKEAIEIWNKYAGKPYGEKTREKIRKEIEEKTNCAFWIENSYSIGFTLSPSNVCSNDYNISLNTVCKNGKEIAMLSADNKILLVNFDNFKIAYINKKYIYNIPAMTKEAMKRYKAAQEAQEELRKACREYMDIHVSGLPETNERTNIFDFYI